MSAQCRQAAWPVPASLAVSWSRVSAVPGPACSSLQHSVQPAPRPPNCSCVQQQCAVSQSLSPQLTKMCHFIIISGCQQCSSSSNPRPRCISAPEFGDLTHKNQPPAWPSRSFAFTQRSSVAKTQTSLSLARSYDEEYSQLIALSIRF